MGWLLATCGLLAAMLLGACAGTPTPSNNDVAKPGITVYGTADGAIGRTSR
jgi:hypothetical protein